MGGVATLGAAVWSALACAFAIAAVANLMSLSELDFVKPYWIHVGPGARSTGFLAVCASLAFVLELVSWFLSLCSDKATPTPAAQGAVEHKARFLIDNSVLNATTPGLAFRKSKTIEDRCFEFASWGTVVEGTDEGDEWINVGSLYLPTKLNGVLVVKSVTDQGAVEHKVDLDDAIKAGDAC